MTTRLTVEEILAGVGQGRMQSVGPMGVIPLVDEDGSLEDDTIAPPDGLRVGTRDYGTVDLENQSDRTTIVPPGAGWSVKAAAQDHAIGSGVLMKPKERKHIDTAMCIESSQGGLIGMADHEMLILPAALRTDALGSRHQRQYNKLWNSIGTFNQSLGVGGHAQHLAYFLKQYEKELDEFVAEFELVPNQIGAVVVIGDKVVGIERAPSVAFWNAVWEPLIRICYGSLAIKAQKDGIKPAHRVPLNVGEKTLAGLAVALEQANMQADRLAKQLYETASSASLQAEASPDQVQGDLKLLTLANTSFAGQIVQRNDRIPYASLCSR